MANFFERIMQVSDYKGYKNPNDFARNGLNWNSSEKINRLKGGDRMPSVEMLLEISNKFEDIDANWLLTGRGNMLKSKDLGVSNVAFQNAPAVITIDNQQSDNIVLVPQAVQAGYMSGGFADIDFIRKLPSYHMPGLNNGIFRMFEVQGNSMFPTIPSRSYVVGQFVENWITDIKDNQIYVIISNEVENGIVKRVINRIEKYNNLLCKSDNRRDYPTQNINPSSIREVWEVKLHLNFSLPDPADLYDRMNDLEIELQEIKRMLK